MLYAAAPIKAVAEQIIWVGSFFEKISQRPMPSSTEEARADSIVRGSTPDETSITQTCVNVGSCWESNPAEETMWRVAISAIEVATDALARGAGVEASKKAVARIRCGSFIVHPGGRIRS